MKDSKLWFLEWKNEKFIWFPIDMHTLSSFRHSLVVEIFDFQNFSSDFDNAQHVLGYTWVDTKHCDLLISLKFCGFFSSGCISASFGSTVKLYTPICMGNHSNFSFLVLKRSIFKSFILILYILCRCLFKIVYPHPHCMCFWFLKNGSWLV